MNKLVTMFRRIAVAVSITIIMTFTLLSAQNELPIEPGGIIGGYTGAACVQGDYAYLNQGTVLTVLDVSGDRFENAASLVLSSEPVSIIINNERLFLFGSGQDSALNIVDVSNPLQPALLGTAEMAGHWRAKMHCADDFVYIAAVESLKVVDVSNSSSPVLVRSFPIQANDVFVVDTNAFVANDAGLSIYSLVGTDSLKLVGQFPTEQKDGVVVQGNYAYVAGRRTEHPNAGVQILDI